MTRQLEVTKAIIASHQPYDASAVPEITMEIVQRLATIVDNPFHVPIKDLVKYNVGHTKLVGI